MDARDSASPSGALSHSMRTLRRSSSASTRDSTETTCSSREVDESQTSQEITCGRRMRAAAVVMPKSMIWCSCSSRLQQGKCGALAKSIVRKYVTLEPAGHSYLNVTAGAAGSWLGGSWATEQARKRRPGNGWVTVRVRLVHGMHAGCTPLRILFQTHYLIAWQKQQLGLKTHPHWHPTPSHCGTPSTLARPTHPTRPTPVD
mgnify:CR=1 FL=1